MSESNRVRVAACFAWAAIAILCTSTGCSDPAVEGADPDVGGAAPVSGGSEATVGGPDPVFDENDEFRKAAEEIRRKLASALPEHWAATPLSAHRRPSGRRLPETGVGVFSIGLRYALAPPPGPRSGPDQNRIVISPKGLLWLSRDNSPFSPVSESMSYDSFFGSSEVADFYLGRPLRSDEQPELTVTLLSEALGVHGRHSSIDFLEFELSQYIHGEPLFKRIRERCETDRLRFAEWALRELRGAGPRKFAGVFPVLPGVLLQQLPHDTVWPSTEDPVPEKRQEVMRLWQAWVDAARGKTAEEWMRGALQQSVGLVAHENLWLAQDAVCFLEKITGRKFGAVRLVSDESRVAVIKSWATWLRKNGDRLRWDADQEQFVLP